MKEFQRNWVFVVALAAICAIAAITIFGPGCAAQAHPVSSPNPAATPIQAAEQAVAVGRHVLEWVAGIALVVLGGCFGLYFTPISWVNTFAIPISAGVLAAAWAGVIVIPFTPWVIGIGAAIALGLGGYEVYVYLTKRKAAAGTAAAPVIHIFGSTGGK